YKEYYAIASGGAPPKTKASVRKTKSSSDTTITPPTITGTRLSTLAKGKQPAESSKAKGLTVLSEVAMTEDDEDQDDNDDDQDTDNDGDDFVHPKLSIHEEEEAKDEESFDPIVQTQENSDDEVDDDVSLGLNVGDVHTTQDFKDTHVTLTLVNPDGQQQSSSVSSQFVTSMLNPSLDAGIDSLFETTPWVDVQASTTVAPLTLTAPTFPPPTILTISETLKAKISELVQTNQSARAISSILVIVKRYMDQQMNEVVKVIKEQVKEQVKTSYAVAAGLSEMELKKILIEKMESNKSIH
nr:hypothetical protein [Tanacetum cinerariifolium]